jgi:hypothetical protein
MDMVRNRYKHDSKMDGEAIVAKIHDQTSGGVPSRAECEAKEAELCEQLEHSFVLAEQASADPPSWPGERLTV